MQGRVVQPRLAFAQVVHEQVTHRAAFDAVAVDQLLTAQLALRPQPTHRRRVAGEHAGRAQQLIEVRAARRPCRHPVFLGARSSCTQSPTVMSPTPPPLAARMARDPA